MKVVAVADQRSNSFMVGAPDDLMPALPISSKRLISP